MKSPRPNLRAFAPLTGCRPGMKGFSLLEMVVAIGVTSLVLVVLGLLSVNGLQSFLVMGNCAALDDRSRLAADLITRELRQATRIVSYKAEDGGRTLVLTNSVQAYSVEYAWSADTRTLTCEKTDEPLVTYLQDCESWQADFYQNTPQPSITQPYLPATNFVGQLDLEQARIVTLSWKCSRPVTGSKIKTESARTVQVALRNMPQP